MTSTEKNLNDFFLRCDDLANKIETSREQLIELLLRYETFTTAEDEIERSLETLRGASNEFAPLNNPLSGLTISTFFPLNLPLYSLVLFGIMPSAFSKQVFIRPPDVMKPVLAELVSLLDISSNFRNISYYSLHRNIFVELYAKDSDAIIFTGKYENALDIHKKCPDAVLLYNGSGVNPFIIFNNGNVDLAVEKSIEMRCFNSGQDCAGPDVFFVEKDVTDKFVELLIEKLKHIKVGDSSDRTVQISKTIKVSYINELERWLEKKNNKALTDIRIEKGKNLVYPIVTLCDADKLEDEFHEFFAPIFNIVSFNSEDDLLRIMNMQNFQDRGMYISVFGSNDRVTKELGFVKILRNQIVNDTEKGNEEYGGYGKKANFILSKNEFTVQPILISRDLHASLQR